MKSFGGLNCVCLQNICTEYSQSIQQTNLVDITQFWSFESYNLILDCEWEHAGMISLMCSHNIQQVTRESPLREMFPEFQLT